MRKGIELGDISGDIGDVFCKKVVFFLAKSLKILYLCMYFKTSTNNQIMEEKKLRFDDAPWGYPLCFRAECPKAAECMHYLMGTKVPPERTTGQAVYPSAWKDGECKRFAQIRKVTMAYGFSQLYDNVPRHLKAEARMRVRHYFGSGVSSYYRYHHGERYLMPQQQEDIMAIIAQYGSTDNIRFDYYVVGYDFT